MASSSRPREFEDATIYQWLDPPHSVGPGFNSDVAEPSGYHSQPGTSRSLKSGWVYEWADSYQASRTLHTIGQRVLSSRSSELEYRHHNTELHRIDQTGFFPHGTTWTMAAVAYRLDPVGEKVALFLMIDEDTEKVVRFADSSRREVTTSSRMGDSGGPGEPFDPQDTYVTLFAGLNDGSELYWDTEVRGSEVKSTADLFTKVVGQFKTVDEHHCMIQARYAWKWNDADGGQFDIYRGQDYHWADIVREIERAPYKAETCCIVMRVCHIFD